jgi:threonine aldolase
MRVSDFRSDTVTRPTGAMYSAMTTTELGDDVFGDDPATIRLESEAADRFGKEACLFVPSGTMGNLIAILVHCRPGDEILLEEHAHSFHFEVGGGAAYGGVQTRTIPSDHGIPDIAALDDAFRPNNIHIPRTRLVIYENTNNISGGVIVPLDVMREIRRLSAEQRVAVHLDGARIWHAHVETGISLAEYATCADSLLCCLSKALSAPVGSLLLGDREFIARARRTRKRLGGGMRQAGVLAAAGRVAMGEMVERLAEDHARARRLAEAMAGVRGVDLDLSRVQTNIVVFQLTGANPPYARLTEHLREDGVWVTNLWDRGIRWVTHRGIADDDVERALASMARAEKAGILS